MVSAIMAAIVAAWSLPLVRLVDFLPDAAVIFVYVVSEFCNPVPHGSEGHLFPRGREPLHQVVQGRRLSHIAVGHSVLKLLGLAAAGLFGRLPPLVRRLFPGRFLSLRVNIGQDAGAVRAVDGVAKPDVDGLKSGELSEGTLNAPGRTGLFGPSDS